MHIQSLSGWGFVHLFTFLIECQGDHTAPGACPTAAPAADAAFLQCSDTGNQTILKPTSQTSYQLPLTVCPFFPLVLSPLCVSNDPGFSSLAFLPLFSRKKFTLHFSHTVTGQRDLQGDYSGSKTKNHLFNCISCASQGRCQGSHFPHNFTNTHQRKKWHSQRQARKLCRKGLSHHKHTQHNETVL